MTIVVWLLAVLVGCLVFVAVAALIDVMRCQSRPGRCACGTWAGLDDDLAEICTHSTVHSIDRCQPTREVIR